MTARASQSLRVLRRVDPPRQRVVCFPCAGGSVRAYAELVDGFDPDIEVLGYLPPGRDERFLEEPLDTIQQHAALAFSALAAFDPLPCVVYGHSMGGLTAFELALRMQASGDMPVSLLIASACSAPHTPAEATGYADMDDAAFVAELRRIGGTPEHLFETPELLSVLLPAIRADFVACERYRCEPGATLRIPVVVCGGEHDPDVDPDGLDAWSAATSAQVRIRRFAGGHFFIHDAGNAFADRLRRDTLAARDQRGNAAATPDAGAAGTSNAATQAQHP